MNAAVSFNELDKGAKTRHQGHLWLSISIRLDFVIIVYSLNMYQSRYKKCLWCFRFQAQTTFDNINSFNRKIACFECVKKNGVTRYDSTARIGLLYTFQLLKQNKEINKEMVTYFDFITMIHFLSS